MSNFDDAIRLLRWVETDIAYKAPEQAAEAMETWREKITRAKRLLIEQKRGDA